MKYILFLFISLFFNSCLISQDTLTHPSISISSGLYYHKSLYTSKNQLYDKVKLNASLQYTHPLKKNISAFSILDYQSNKENISISQNLENDAVRTHNVKYASKLIYDHIGLEYRTSGINTQLYFNAGLGIAYHFSNKTLNGFVKTYGLDDDYTRISKPEQFKNGISFTYGLMMGVETRFTSSYGFFINYRYVNIQRAKTDNPFNVAYIHNEINIGTRIKV